MVAHACNLMSQEAEAGASLWVQGQPGLHSELKANQNYKVRPYLKTHKKVLLKKYAWKHFDTVYTVLTIFVYLYVHLGLGLINSI